MAKIPESFSNLVDAFNSLPTVGKKSALRFAYHLVLNDVFGGMKLSHAIEDALKNITKCKKCGGISEHEICDICLDEHRDKNLLCIVENAKDIFIIEQNANFDGFYFVLDSLNDENIQNLATLISQNNTNEIIFALTPSLSSDAIMLYIEDKFLHQQINFTKIAQGVPTGVNLENVDTLSLTKALQSRIKI